MVVHLVCGDEVGFVKLVRVSEEATGDSRSLNRIETDAGSKNGGNNGKPTINSVLARWGVQTLEKRIQSLCLSSGGETVIAALKNNAIKEVEFKKGLEGNFQPHDKQIENELGGSESPIVSLCKFPADEDGKEILASCSQDGWVECFRYNDSSFVSTSKFEVGGPVERMRICSGTTIFATGGKENDLSLWDIMTNQCTFRARNVPHDKLDMRVPIWVTDMVFPKLPGGDGNMVWTCTGYGQIRIYDVRAQQRPVHSKRLSNFGHMKTMVSINDSTLVVGDVQGQLAKFDVSTMRISGHFKGFAGGIRNLDLHPTKPLLASCGLDRIIRVHNLSTRKIVGEIYVKQKLTDVKFYPLLDQCNLGNPVLEKLIGKKRKLVKDTSKSPKFNRGSNIDCDDDEIMDLGMDSRFDSEDDGMNSTDDDEGASAGTVSDNDEASSESEE